MAAPELSIIVDPEQDLILLRVGASTSRLSRSEAETTLEALSGDEPALFEGVFLDRRDVRVLVELLDLACDLLARGTLLGGYVFSARKEDRWGRPVSS